MSEVRAFAGEPESTAGPPGVTTLVEGSSFAISSSSGDIEEGATHGLFVRDTRILSEWVLEVDDTRLEPLTVMVEDPFRAVFLSRTRPRRGHADSTLLVVRERVIGDGMRETVRLRNLGGETAAVTMELRVGADFANLFEVKEGRVRGHRGITTRPHADLLELRQDWRSRSRSVLVAPRCEGRTTVRAGYLAWHPVVPAHEEWSCDVVTEPTHDGHALTLREHDDGSRYARAHRRAGEWRATAPVVHTTHPGLTRILERSVEDLGALRIDDPHHPERVTVAAGAPWFMAQFGRDSLLSSWMTLPVDTDLALGTLQSLADKQGDHVDPRSEEEPGRILHEVRFDTSVESDPTATEVYYGTADATPLFVMLLGELRRWGSATDRVDALLPAADRALEWVTEFGDRDGDGFVEYQRATDRGLRNQGWKDSWDGVNFADGRLADPPIALCEVQGYVYAAYVARAHFAREAGEDALCSRWSRRAADLRAAFNERFWLPDREWFAVGLDRDKRPIDALASTMGHCLWTGIVDQDKAEAVAAHLLGPELFSGWGVRTLASSMAAYNPLSYHNGSVWPHDNAIIADGLMRYGFVDQAQRVAEGILKAAEAFGGRLPELFSGFERSEFARPVPFPTSCSPQAWASAAPLHLLRTLLRFSPAVPRGVVHLGPVVPAQYLPLRFDHVPLAGSRVSLEVTGDGFDVRGLPPGVVITGPRAPGSAPLMP